MRLIPMTLAAMTALILACGPAAAQWREIVYPDLGVGKEWPAEPTRTKGEYKTEVVGKEGVPADILQVEVDNIVYKMTVADLQKPEFVARSASLMGECVFDAEEAGTPLANMTNRVEGGINAVYGRLVSVDLADNKGRRQTACLFTKGRLYIIEATVLPAHGQPNSSQVIRFTNSLRFAIDRDYH